MKRIRVALAAIAPWTFFQSLPIDLEQAAARFKEAEIAAKRDGGALWGLSLAGPLFFVDPGTRSIVANRVDLEGKLTEREGVFVGTLPPEIAPANTAIDWAGVRWTMVMWPALSSDEHERARLLLHELFHRIQNELGLPAMSPANAHLAETQGRLWLRAELRALRAALLSEDEERRAALDDALCFRAQRRALFEAAASEEDALERNEGMAEYTGLALCGRERSAIRSLLAQRIEKFETSSSFARSFAYETGPAYGLLLDELHPSWREALKGGKALSSIAEQAISFAIKADQLDSRSQARLRVYGGDALRLEEEALERARLARAEELRSRFLTGPVLRLRNQGSFRFSFDPNRAEILAGHGTVYPTLQASDAWGVLEVQSGGALLPFDFSAVIIPASTAGSTSGSKVSGDGWTLELAEGWTLVPGKGEGNFEVAKNR